MRRLQALSLYMVLPIAAACAKGETLGGVGGSDRGGGSAGGNGGSSTTGNGGATSSTGGPATGPVPTTCAQAGDYAGCCDGNESYYCATGSTTVTHKVCPTGQVCGWNATKLYYSCVAPPGGVDPSNTHPIACQ